jgi:hypothetical protein
VRNEKARRFLANMRKKPGVDLAAFFPRADRYKQYKQGNTRRVGWRWRQQQQWQHWQRRQQLWQRWQR